MKTRLLNIAYWFAAIILIAVIVTSLGYRFSEAFFIGTLFLPGALAVKLAYHKISFKEKKEGVKNAVFVTIGIMVGEILMFMIAHLIVSSIRIGIQNFYQWPDLPEMLLNPIFIALIIAVLAVGNYFWEKWLDGRLPSAPAAVTFISDRHSVTLLHDEIIYVESNDAVTTVYASGDRQFRNRTPISQWESILEGGFVRIHRSYLVNRDYVTGTDPDTVFIGEIELPVSRKYKDSLSGLA